MEIRTKKFLKRLVLLFAASSLVSCTAHSHRDAGPAVPSHRRYETSLLKPSARRNVRLTIAREKGVAGSGLNLYLDGNELARIAAGEALTVYVSPRRHVVTARPLFSPSASMHIEPKPHQPMTLRIIDRNGNFQFVIADRAWLSSVGRSVESWTRRPFGSSPDSR